MGCLYDIKFKYVFFNNRSPCRGRGGQFAPAGIAIVYNLSGPCGNSFLQGLFLLSKFSNHPIMNTHPSTSHSANGAQLLIELLKQQGIHTIFGVPGGSILPVYDALHGSGIRHILARHEQGAGFMAQGIARATGRPAVCMATSGPGAVNLLTAISDAFSDSVPVIAISGQVPQALMGTAAFQEVDIVAMTRGITKRSFLVTDVNALPGIVDEAFRIAVEGRPGPVWIDIPKDVQLASFTGHLLPRHPLLANTPPDCTLDIDAIGQMLQGASSPAIIAGHGIVLADASSQLQHIAEQLKLPVVSTLHGLGAMPASHPLNRGMAGMHGHDAANRTLLDADVIIALGIRFDDRLTGKITEFCPHARFVHVDINPNEHNRIKQVELAVVADLKVFMTQWAAQLKDVRLVDGMMGDQVVADEPDTPGRWIRSFAELLPADAIVTTDVGQHQMWVAQWFPFSPAMPLLTSGGQGTMGFGLPAAIGAAVAYPHRKVVCFTGDGSLLMNIQELATLAELKLNITIVLMNNAGLGMVRQQQHLFFGQRFSASQYHHTTHFGAIARAFGIGAVEASMGDGAVGVSKKELMASSPLFINLMVDGHEMVSPIMQPGHSIQAMMACRHHGNTEVPRHSVLV